MGSVLYWVSKSCSPVALPFIRLISIANEDCAIRHVLYALTNYLIESAVDVAVTTLLTSLLKDLT